MIHKSYFDEEGGSDGSSSIELKVKGHRFVSLDRSPYLERSTSNNGGSRRGELSFSFVRGGE